MRRPIRVGAEENDLVWMKSLGDLPSETPNGGHWNMGRLVAVAQEGSRGLTAILGHVVMLLAAEAVIEGVPESAVCYAIRRLASAPTLLYHGFIPS